MKQEFDFRLQLVVFALLLLRIGLANAAADSPPNVVFIYIDDYGYSDAGFMGSEIYQTPHIDALANSGMVFTSAYAAGPNCAPSRACLMSGQYGPRHGVFTVGNSDRGKSELRKLVPVKNNTVLASHVVTMAEIFQSADYATAHFGKWHLGSAPQSGPLAQGFDVNFGGNQSGSPRGGHFSPFQNPQLTDPKQGREYLTDRLTAEAVSFISQHRDEPFFVYLSHYAVHTPIQAKQKLTAKYKEAASQQGFNAKYAAMIESVDQSVRDVMDALKKFELEKNTLVVFYSDNGGHGKITSCAPLRGSKGMLYEGGIRVPLAIRWPGVIAAGQKCHEPVIGVDFFPTVVQLLGVQPPGEQVIDGVSLLSLLKGETKELKREAIFWHFPAYLQGKDYPGAADRQFRTRPASAIRHGDWKLLEFYEDGRRELYHLASDIGESKNLAESNPEITAGLSQKLEAWRNRINAPVPKQLNPDFQQ